MSILWLTCIVVVATNVASGRAAIVGYETEIVRAGDFSKGSYHWAKYIEGTGPNTRRISSFRDGIVHHEELGFMSPFFSSDNISWHVSPFGFLTSLSFPPCSSSCVRTTLRSLRKQSEQPKSSDRFLPMIGVYVADFSPFTKVFTFKTRYPNDERAESGGCHIVEYRSMLMHGCSSSEKSRLKAQVEVCSDGLIVMRYREVPKCGPVSVGIALSAREQNFTFIDSDLEDIVAIRYSPVHDNCSKFSTNRSCNDMHGRCKWHETTDECVDESVAKSRSPRRTRSESIPASNEYYDLKVSRSSRNVDYDDLQKHFKLLTVGKVVGLDLGFSFPFFARDQPNLRTNRVYIHSSGVISLFSEKQNCKPVRNMCPNGDYSFAIMPFVTPQTWASRTSVEYSPLGKRVKGDPFCNDSHCLEGIAIRVSSRTYDLSLHKYQHIVYLDQSGAIEFRYSEGIETFLVLTGKEFSAVPPPYIGISRSGINDKNTIIVPPSLIGEDKQVRFDTSQSCSHCGANGRCVSPTGKCECFEGHIGKFCEECSPGHYGPSCIKCRKCENGGTCDDGRKGSGGCKCMGMFSGENCTTKCANSFDCSNCNLHGGYCECGTCHCYGTNGWSGENCSVFQDPCQRLSFGGCKVCLNDTANECAFCSDWMCYSKRLKGTMNEYHCPGNIFDEDPSLCLPLPQPDAPMKENGIAIPLGLSLCALFLACVTLILLRFVLLTRGIVNFLDVGAAGGAPSHVPARREREVVQFTFIPRAAAEGKKYVLGIPLKQIPLQKLYNYQEAQRERQNQSQDSPFTFTHSSDRE
ncbi:hypothetical protein, conserved [Trypanosoma brucei brucei TREU927]|uniref:EGF-like domain-containing protein n=1 Tax=Trypanosoma brucei brucei (strain 927/4 GUTat10.1) TaxID=185431 RepID=Q585S4_TRYB2|nr:hypothetical protein, conserved [Trypanosoma brucei brucei TREU927]AAQ15634.1 hypothetical protein, conserved [Trypanosoma brucei brucei TREU927]AAX79536.1 hypothetical protein, conserved [Trypanosoma brucei]